MDWRRMQHKSFGPEDAVEEVHQIHGTGKSFSSKPDDLDEKATEAFDEILRKGIDGLEVLDAFGIMDPQHLPKGFFLSSSASYWKQILLSYNKAKGIWRPDRGLLGYGIVHHASGYRSLKRTLVHYKDNHKTNLIIVAYNLIHEDGNIKYGDVLLCHVFQSDNYDPRPNQRPNPFLPRVPNFFDFHKRELDSRMLRLEDLMKNPESFKDFYELDEMYSKCQTNGRNGKRAGVWEHFTPIKVIGPDGEVMLTLAICHGCSMAYLTGKWDSKKGSLSNNGTKTLKEHNRKCSGQCHVAGNPQGAHHQMP